MKSYKGAVLFVDLLGFGALTRGRLDLSNDALAAWEVDPSGQFPHQVLAAKLLLRFRKTLTAAQKQFPEVRFAQLSDCAFLWSADSGALLDAGQALLHEVALAGLLCRGGIAYGDVHEPNTVRRSLGEFVVGDAVTRAVNHESQGKGARVFTDEDSVRALLRCRPDVKFHPITNPLTGEIMDEWRWYAPRNEQLRDNKQLRGYLYRLAKLHVTFRFSPKLSWSASTLEGRRQLACSSVAISGEMERRAGETGTFALSVDTLIAADGAERVNDFATPGFMNLLCRVEDCGRGVSPGVAG